MDKKSDQARNSSPKKMDGFGENSNFAFISVSNSFYCVAVIFLLFITERENEAMQHEAQATSKRILELQSDYQNLLDNIRTPVKKKPKKKK